MLLFSMLAEVTLTKQEGGGGAGGGAGLESEGPGRTEPRFQVPKVIRGRGLRFQSSQRDRKGHLAQVVTAPELGYPQLSDRGHPKASPPSSMVGNP